ncbi:acylneuraminate cytidylyltransferase family protein [uncultured Roseibium sp.]|uniref:acylneuraminate cytidylyltransferase family protein n=1 Tax=uncultured Roseibium sp. TaxID=1936171 RepID=UPI002637E47B|nr:acylneuraminate cytidylyltransferase family protein [uncultured Roseibium sp.]
MKTIAIIPARGGSKGLPGKNIKLLDGHPLIAYPISAARLSGACDEIIVTTDSEEIADVARRYGANVPFIRPRELAQDLSTTEETLQHALASYEELANEAFDICVFLTATDIFRNPAWIKQAVDALKNDPDLESAFSVQGTHKNYWIKNDDDEGYSRLQEWMASYSSRQVRKKIYREDTGLTCASRAHLWRNGRRIGDSISPIINDRTETGLDIHSEFDFFLCEQAIAWLKANDPDNAPQIIEPKR